MERKKRWKLVSEMTPERLERTREQKRDYMRRHLASLSQEGKAEHLAKRRESEIPMQREWRRAHRAETNSEASAQYWKDPEKVRARQKRYRQAEKREVISHYGGICRCCGEDELVFLSIDHAKGDGKEHRESDRSATLLYRWLKKNGYPEGFQVLCFNCNMAKRRLPECPHASLVRGRFMYLGENSMTQNKVGGGDN